MKHPFPLLRAATFLCLLIALHCTDARAQLNKFTGFCEQGGQSATTSGVASSTKHPKALPGATATVYQPDTTTTLSIYSDAAGLTPKSNPFTCSSTDASFTFYYSGSYVDFRLSGTGVTSPFTHTLSTVTPLGAADSRLDYVTPKQYGALGDGTGSLVTTAAAAAHTTGTAYPWVAGICTVGVDTLDWCGLQQATYAAFYSGTTTPNKLAGVNNNKPLKIPHGNYVLNRTWTVTLGIGDQILGDGRFTTTITQTATNTPVLTTNGFGYGEVRGIRFRATANNTGALVEWSWDNTGGAGALQSDTFADCHFDGTAATVQYGLRIGVGGYMGSEILLLNDYFNGFQTAALSTENFNALQVTMVGGNIQSCPKWGVSVSSGSVNLYSVGFQNGVWAQLQKGGADLRIANSSDTHSSMRDCRSESAVMATSANGHALSLDNNSMRTDVTAWSSGASLPRGTMYTGVSGGLADGRLYYTTTAGTSGTSEPTAAAGTATSATATTLTDSGAVWTTNAFAGRTLKITGGTGSGQIRIVQSNTSTALTISSNNPWTTTPDATSTYSVSGWAGGGSSTQLVSVSLATPNTLTDASGSFEAGIVGKTIVIPGAGAAGADLVTTVTARASGGSITINDAASTAVTNSPAFWATPVSASGGTAQWIHIEFAQLSGDNLSVTRNTFKMGYLGMSTGNAFQRGHMEIVGNSFSRADGLKLGAIFQTGTFADVRGNVVHLGGGRNTGNPSVSAYSFSLTNSGGALYNGLSQFNLGGQAIVFSRGSGTVPYGDVGLEPGAGTTSTTNIGDNELKVIGGSLVPKSVTFIQLGTPSNGALLYCSDCTKATPCASGGSGAFAKRINGAWDCN